MKKLIVKRNNLCKQRIWTRVGKNMLKLAKSNISLLLSTL